MINNEENNPFDDERLHGASSALIAITPDNQGRFIYDLWSQYTRLGLDGIQVGDMVGVENYTPTQNGEKIYSVLAISQVFPVHYAAQGVDAYPGHVFESMKSIKEDWESQDDEPRYLTTTISIKAVPTGYQFTHNARNLDQLPKLQEEKNIPMIGAEIRPLSMAMVDATINQEMEGNPDSPFTHKKFEELNVKLNQESLITTHFGIFGFTGVGKSNLASSLVSSLCYNNMDNNANFVIFDPNDEYLGLFVDKFAKNKDEISYIHIGTDSLHTSISEELGDNLSEPSDIVIKIMKQQLRLPPALLSKLKNDKIFEDYIEKALRNIFYRTRIVMPYQDVLELIIKKVEGQIEEKTGKEVRAFINEVKALLEGRFSNQPISEGNISDAIKLLDGDIVKDLLQNIQGGKQGTAKGILERAKKDLIREEQRLSKIPNSAITSIADIIESINKPGQRQTVIITGRRDSEIKHFSSVFGNEVYEKRRSTPERKPFISFIFDEADLFIPQNGSDESTKEVREFCVTLARRGRKFGLGLGISTQRSSLLDTEVMANLHTYFVSKLPRSADRQKVAEAFGISDEQLSPTFTFKRGNWLIISHDSTGLKGVPIPVTAVDANQRIINASLNLKSEG